MKNYIKNIYYYKKPRHIYAVFCSESFIRLIDPKQSYFKKADDWFTNNYWSLLIETLFNVNQIKHEITID